MYLGEFRNRVTIQSLGGSTDAGGGQSSTFSDVTTVWSKVEKLSGQEGLFGDQLRDTSGYKFTIRYYSSLTTKHRLSYRSKTFDITSITDIREGKLDYQEIIATEGVAT